jgi:hypothetical protein
MKWPVPLLVLPLLILAQTSVSQEISTASGPQKATIVEVRKVWDQAPHNAFTDLVRFQDRWLCVFREGQGHVSPDGSIRIIVSPDGRDWSPLAVLRLAGADLRDPKFTITPDGRLMVVAAAARDRKPNGEARHQSMVWFSWDGRDWDEGHAVADPDFWLWRVVWHNDTAYGVGYGCSSDRKFVRLYKSRDGVRFDRLVDHLYEKDYPNESGLVILEGGTSVCLLRRDEGSRTGMLGMARPPYTEWTWSDLGMPIGGPQMITGFPTGVSSPESVSTTRRCVRPWGGFAPSLEPLKSLQPFPPAATPATRALSGTTGCSG